MKGILPRTGMIILNKYYSLPVHKAPVHSQQLKVRSCSPSSVSCIRPDSLRNDQTKSASLGAQADERKGKQLETSLEVQPDDMTGNHRDGEHNGENHKFRRKRTRW